MYYDVSSWAPFWSSKFVCIFYRAIHMKNGLEPGGATPTAVSSHFLAHDILWAQHM